MMAIINIVLDINVAVAIGVLATFGTEGIVDLREALIARLRRGIYGE